MPIEIGQVEAIFRYPVKSMGGEQLDAANLGWHGLDGDRRLAFRRIDYRGGFPWLSASQLPDLLLFTPQRPEDGAPGDLPTHVRTPDGEEMPILGENLAAVAERWEDLLLGKRRSEITGNISHGQFETKIPSWLPTREAFRTELYFAVCPSIATAASGPVGFNL